MGSRSDPGWRDHASAELLAKVLEGDPPPGPVLLVDHPPDHLPPAVAALTPDRWDRADTGDRPGSPWPRDGGYGAALLRLPRSREALAFALDAVVSVTRPGGPVFVFGAKDEGIGSTASRLQALLDEVVSMATGGRCRILRGLRAEAPAGLRGRLEDWREVAPLELPWGVVDWVRYPGTFARAGVDPGTALLLDHLPTSPEAAPRVLDVGAGTGLLAAGIRAERVDAEVWLAEPDALARAAAAENVPGARFVPVPGWAGEGPWDRIVSNPPYHQGKGETLQVVRDLIRGARLSLAPGGELRLVVQRRHPVEGELREAFPRVEAVADAGPYRVWAASDAGSR